MSTETPSTPAENSAPVESPAASPVHADIQIPARSRIFTEDDARKVLELFAGDPGDPNADPPRDKRDPSQNVGYGDFDSAGSARSAGNALNRLLSTLGAPHKYAITTFVRDGRHVGVMLNKPAKKVEGHKSGGRKPAASKK